jgi:hypothetical protein
MGRSEEPRGCVTLHVAASTAAGPGAPDGAHAVAYDAEHLAFTGRIAARSS